MRILIVIILVPFLLSAQWNNITGPGQTSITAMAKQGNSLVVGTSGQGLFRTTDQGLTWSSLNGTLTGFSVNALFAWDTLLLAGISAGSDKGLYQGYELGRTWKKITSPFSNTAVLCITRIDSVILAGGASVYRSSDRGVSWQNASNGITAGNKITAFAVNGSSVFAASDLGVFRSTDLGSTWTQVRTNTLYTELSTSITAANGKVYVTNQNGGVNAGKDTIYRTTDNGVTWTNTKKNLPAFLYGQYVMAYGDTVFYGMQSDGMFRSTDAGQTWAVDTNGLWNKRTICGLIDGNMIYSGGSGEFGGTGGLYLSSNNGNLWNRRINPLHAGMVTDLAQVGDVIIANVNTNTTSKGMYRSTDRGRTWSRPNNALTGSGSPAMIAGMFPFKGMVFCGATTNVAQGLYATSDSGQTWNTVNTGLPNFSTLYSFFADADTLYAGLKEGLYRSTNLGGTWTKWGTGIATSNIYAMAMKNDTMFAANGTQNIYRSVNRGRTWSVVKTNQNIYVPTRLMVFDNTWYSISSTNSGKLFVCSDTGAVWNEVNAAVLGTTVSNMLVSGRNLIVTVDAKGLLYSSNGGASWTPVTTGVYKGSTQTYPTAKIFWDTLFASLSDGGLVRRGVMESGILSVARNAASSPGGYQLEQNYPNPFNPETAISYQLSAAGMVTVTVHDIIGREVATLVNEVKEAGVYTVRFDASHLSSGVYLYSLRSASSVVTKRMLLMK